MGGEGATRGRLVDVQGTNPSPTRAVVGWGWCKEVEVDGKLIEEK